MARGRRRGAATAAAVVSQAPAEAPLDAAVIRSRVEQLSLNQRRAREEEEAPAAGVDADAAGGLSSMFEVADGAMDEWEAVAASVESVDLADLDAYLEWLRKKVPLVEEMNRKASDEIAVLAEAKGKDMIQLDVDIEELEHSLSQLDVKDWSHYGTSPLNELPDSTDSFRSQGIVHNDYKYEVLKLEHEIEKCETDLKSLQNIERANAIWGLESIIPPLRAKVLDYKDNILRVSLMTPILPSDSVVYEHKMDCAVDSFVSDHELLIELGEEIMELEKVQIFPNDVCVDILIEMLKSSREVASSPTLGWLIGRIQHRIIVNALRQSLVNSANNSRHSFEYSEKEETIVAHLVRGIDVYIKTCAEWPLSSYGLKLISIHNSGIHQTNITSSLLRKTKELANGLDLQIRRHLVRFVDSVEEILVRDLQSQLHADRSSG